MTTQGLTRHEQERPPVVTREETLRFVLAVRSSGWAWLAVPMSWRYMPSGTVNTWSCAHTKRDIRKTEVLEKLADAVADDFGFYATPEELEVIYQEVSLLRGTDALHKFMHGCFIPGLASEVSLEDVWERWRKWKPSERPRITQAALIEALVERGYNVQADEHGEGVLKGWRKPVNALTVGTGKRRGKPRAEGN